MDASFASWPAELRARYQHLVDHEAARAYLATTLLAAALFPAGGVLDLFTQPAHLFPLSVIRYGTTLVYLGLFALTRGRALPLRSPFGSGLLLLGIASLSITSMCLVLDGYRSPYYAGINLVVLAAGALFPWGARRIAAAVALVTGIYFAAVLLAAGFGIERPDLLVNNSYFLFATGVISIASGGLSERTRRASFAHLVALEETSKQKRLRDDFISLASHELKTPLTSLKLQAQFVRRRAVATGVENDEARLARRVDEQVDRLFALVENMLDVSRIDHGTLVLERRETDLSSVTQAALSRMSEQFRASSVPVQLTAEQGVLGHWDPERLEQVLTNLLTNALKYGRGQPVHVRAALEDAHAVLEVRDQGIGIPPEDRSKIFQRFERAVADEKVSGMGLGLYITAEIVRAHGGAIHVDSAVGSGSTFTVRLPLRPVAALRAG